MGLATVGADRWTIGSAPITGFFFYWPQPVGFPTGSIEVLWSFLPGRTGFSFLAIGFHSFSFSFFFGFLPTGLSLGCTEFYWVFLLAIKFKVVLFGFKTFLLGSTGFHRVLIRFNPFLLAFTGFPYSLLSSNRFMLGFYLVLLSFPTRYWV